MSLVYQTSINNIPKYFLLWYYLRHLSSAVSASRLLLDDSEILSSLLKIANVFPAPSQPVDCINVTGPAPFKNYGLASLNVRQTFSIIASAWRELLTYKYGY